MKITKYVHSCLLLQTQDRTCIIDPGNFSWNSGLFHIDALEQLDEIIITHEHPDHLYMPFVKVLVEKFPDAKIITTDSVVALLKDEGIVNASSKSTDQVVLFETAHESLSPLGETPQNTGVHYAGLLTHPGDSHHFQESKDILALPITAPWGSVMRAAELAQELKPKYVIPIHDWHWNDEARKIFYTRVSDFCAGFNTTFILTIDGQPIEI